jgi:glycerophosphoryl diester phosphodiesterase
MEPRSMPAASPSPPSQARTPFVAAARPLLWAHRGASRDAPENTLAAFKLAAAQQADGVELDAQLCGSGEVVVLHDSTLGRTTGAVGLVTETSLRRLRTLDAGAFKGEQFTGERIPLLSEVLEALPGLLVNIELKCEALADDGLAARAVACVREARAEGRVLFSSFNPLCLRRTQKLAPEIERALLFESGAPWLLRSAAAAPLLEAAALHPEAVLATPAAVSGWRARGYRLACWTVDDPGQARALWERGVTGLITNQPGPLRAALGMPGAIR